MQASVEHNTIDYLKLLFESGENSDVFQQKITESFPAIIYVYDTEKKKLRYINRKVTDVLGYSYEDIQEWDHDFMKFIFKEDVELVQKELEKFHKLKDEESHSYNSRFNHKEGTWRYFRTQGTVLRRNALGNAASILFIAQDITDQIQSEEESVASKELFRETEALLRFGTWSWDAKKDKVKWSDGMYKMLGYEKEETESKVSNDFYMNHVSEHDKKELNEALQKAMKDKSEFNQTYTIFTKNNEEKIVSTIGKVVSGEEGQLEKIIGVTCDITKQSQANRDLIDYKQMILEKEKFLNYGSWEVIIDDDKSIDDAKIIWSDGMYRLFGYDPQEYRNKLEINSNFYSQHLSEDEIERGKRISDTIFKKKSNYLYEFEIFTKDRIKKKLETFGKVIRDNKGKVVKIVGTTRDVTRLKEYERSLEEKIIELDRSNKELEEFAYIASHDLNEPLRKITTFSERLEEKYGNVLGPDGSAYLKRMLVATENMRLLIDNLLEFSKTNRTYHPFEKLDLNTILKEVISDIELKVEETNANIQLEKLPVIEGIPTQIRQLFNNLLVNAIKFRKPEGVPKITINSKPVSDTEKELHLLRVNLPYTSILINDNGIGFEPEYADRIFHLFQRLHGKAEYPGSGIGLTICKKIIDNHHGVIYADSKPGEGATFHIILPEKQF